MVAVGRAGNGPEAALFARYVARLRPSLRLVEIPEARGSAAEIRRREAALILAAVPPAATLMALDVAGEAPDSVTLSKFWQAWREEARPVAFAIGGAEGLGPEVLDRAAKILSLGQLTWPHLLVRAMLSEQLYRAQSIATGHPYHRSGRP